MPISAFLQILHKDGTRNGTRFGDDGDRSKQSRGSLTRHISQAALLPDMIDIPLSHIIIFGYPQRIDVYMRCFEF